MMARISAGIGENKVEASCGAISFQVSRRTCIGTKVVISSRLAMTSWGDSGLEKGGLRARYNQVYGRTAWAKNFKLNTTVGGGGITGLPEPPRCSNSSNVELVAGLLVWK